MEALPELLLTPLTFQLTLTQLLAASSWVEGLAKVATEVEVRVTIVWSLLANPLDPWLLVAEAWTLTLLPVVRLYCCPWRVAKETRQLITPLIWLVGAPPQTLLEFKPALKVGVDHC